jgi:hypothetical protein
MLLPSRSKNAYFESYKISAKPREIKACGILQSGRFMSEKGVINPYTELGSTIPVQPRNGGGKYRDLIN